MACYYCDNAVEKGDGYKIHMVNKHDKHLQHLEHLHLQWKERFDLKHSNTQCQRQPREEKHKVEEVVACALCKDPVVEGNPYISVFRKSPKPKKK